MIQQTYQSVLQMKKLFQEDRRIIKLFTIKQGISPSLHARITHIGLPHYEWVNQPEQADYLVFPTNYEVGHELTDYYIRYFNGIPEDRQLALEAEEKILGLSRKLTRKILIFYFSDLVDPIPVPNSIIFRTCILKNNNRSNEVAMPAFKPGFPVANTYAPDYLEWNTEPAVGFRGQTAPLALPAKERMRNRINLFFNNLGKDDCLTLKSNFGYLQRRNAIVYLQKNKSIQCNFSRTTEGDVSDEKSIELFWKNVYENPYNLCVSGYGNYSYRFYEVLSAGRIPVFVDTDCKLPFDEFINWKEYVVWLNKNEIPKISRILFGFHYSKTGEEFVNHQKKLKDLWINFLSPDAFFVKLKIYL